MGCKTDECREREKARQARWRAKNRDKAREAAKQWREQHGRDEKAREEARERNKRYREANPDKVRQTKAKWEKANPEYRSARKAARRTREKARLSPLERAVSLAYRQAIQEDPCAYCGQPASHTDHITPLARGGTDHWWNLARACQACNLAKGYRCLPCWLAGRPCDHQFGHSFTLVTILVAERVLWIMQPDQ